MKKIFGFDLGIASIGWAVVNIGKENKNPENGMASGEESEIAACGVRCFNEADNAADRRGARCMRRRLRHRALRMKQIRDLLRRENIIDIAEAEKYGGTNSAYQPIKLDNTDEPIADLRTKIAFNRKLTSRETGRLLYFFAKHRGYDDITYPIEINAGKKSKEPQDKDEKEKAKTTGTIANSLTEMRKPENAGKTMAQIVLEKYGRLRNRTKGAKAQYAASIPRSQIENESRQILAAQEQFGNDAMKRVFDEWRDIAFCQRKYNESDGIMYKKIEEMVGMCKHEKDQPAAPKESPTAELFVALTRINNLKIAGRESEKLTAAERALVLEELYKLAGGMTFARLRKLLNLSETDTFAGLDYEQKNKDGTESEKNPEDAKFYAMTGWHKLKKLFGNNIPEIKILDKIVTAAATGKTPAGIEEKLKAEPEIPKNLYERIKKLTSSKFIKISLKALYNIVPYMEQGLFYNEACEEYNKTALLLYNPRDTGGSFLDDTDKCGDEFLKRIDMKKLGSRVTSPVAKRTISQFRRVYNAMVRKYGAPDEVHVECGRELKKSPDERRNIAAENAQRRRAREAAIENHGKENATRGILYDTQGGKCPYCGKKIEVSELGKCEIDHILPYSRSLDNGFGNKVLAHAKCNQDKRDRTPYEWSNQEKNSERKMQIGGWDDFKAHAKAIIKNPQKRLKLLNTTFAENEKEFAERNACDNAIIANFVVRYVKDCTKGKVAIRTPNGSLTAFLRHQWGLEKNRDESSKHHAQDAIVIACATQGLIQFLQTWAGKMESDLKWNKNQANRKLFRAPWKNFRGEVLEKLQGVFVSRPPQKKATGALHKETIASGKKTATGLDIRHGKANGGNKFRFDLFRKKGKFIAVPITFMDLSTQNAEKSFIPDGLAIDDFVMTLHKDDCVCIKTADSAYDKFYIQELHGESFLLYAHDWAVVNRSIREYAEIVKIGNHIIFDGKDVKVHGFDQRKNKIIAKYKDFNKNEKVAEIEGEQTEDGKLRLAKPVKKLVSIHSVGVGKIKEIIKYDVDMLGKTIREVKNHSYEPVANIAIKNSAWKAEHKKRKERIAKGDPNYGLAHPEPDKTM
ncbi:MAG: type II CRISPR RNA-guided endonuclease Cas9 [Rickettsiales bacterium]|jgi:CRISPR-associated endonuclease Csn1|nr:type II CRISPR RNA-guided endonuclease Cas9 [Rickettsiales bacterium]